MIRFLLLPILLVSGFIASAHKVGSCAEAQQQHFPSNAKAALASPALELYDVNYVKIDLTMSNLNTDIAGNAITKATVTSSSGMGRYVFELDSNLTIDSAKVNGVLRPVNYLGGNVFNITLSTTLADATPFTTQVYYHGKSLVGSGFFTHGLNHNFLSTGTQITYSISDMYLAKDWWPCKQSLTDKIDSADLWFTVPNNTKAGSNGRLVTVTPIGSSTSRYQWHTTYPIDYYLISVAVAPYADYTQMVHFTGSTDSMPVVHYIYDTVSFNPLYKPAIDSTPLMVDYLSTLYGRYPFWREKYGHCIAAPLGGGMEHQTMTTLGAFTTPLIAHELGHQWWGDCVTYASWKDIWMSEGWASYTEQLFVEHFRNVAAAQAYRTTVYNRVLGKIGGTLIVPDVDTLNPQRVFDSRLTYDKGASVAHMLRYIAPADSNFFDGLKAYQSQYAYRTATTSDFKAIMQTAYNRNLDTFFNQWVYGEGYPTYSANWNQIGNTVYVQLMQTTSVPASVANFAMPVELKLSSASGDTTIKVYFNTAQQTYTFNWGRQMTSMLIDPDNQILNKTGLITNDITLAVSPSAVANLLVYPNPAADTWQLSNVPKGSNLKLLDAQGRVVWSRRNAAEKISISGSSLSPGIYTLVVTNMAGGQHTVMLQKR